MKKLSIILGLIVVVFLGSFFGTRQQPANPTVLGGTNLGPDSATTTDYTWPTSGKSIKIGAGVLGSVCIGNATAVGTLALYDATTTQSHADHSTTTLAVINTGTVGACFPYNIAFSRGLIAVMSATLATSTITFQ